MDKILLDKNMKNFKYIVAFSPIILFSGCSALAPTSMETYLSYAKGVVDVATYKQTGKTSNDHILSAFVGKDCKISRILQRKEICVEVDPNSFKYKLFKNGKIVSKDNVVRMKFPSEMYNFDKTVKNYVENKKPKK